MDFEKTYDSLDCEFLYYMMDRLSFNYKWIRWIRAYLELALVSIFVNGSPKKEFGPKRGLGKVIRWRHFCFL